MTIELQSIEVDGNEARGWMEESLQQGFDLSSAVLHRKLLDRGTFLVFAPEGFGRSPLAFRVGGVTRLKLAEGALTKALDDLFSHGAQSVVVEDDMKGATDPVVQRNPEPVAFVGNRILHWCELKDGGEKCAQVIIQGAFGYPLNAFVTTCTASELGLADRQQTVRNLPQLIAENLVAVVVAAFDAESFLIWIKANE